MKRLYRILLKLSLILLIILVVLSTGILYIYIRYSKDLPDVRNIPDPVQSSKIYSDNDTLIAEIYTQRRTIVEPDEIPEIMINALIAIEDKRFFSHLGIDPFAIARALIRNLREGKTIEGASTITMQTARNIFLTRFKSLDRKIKEAILALRLEREYTKREIITIYLNNIYLGRGAYGIYEAAKTYFGKELHELTIEECALIASLPKAPYTYNPYRNMNLALNRRNTVLTRMLELGYITENEFDNAVNTPVSLASEKREVYGSYFIDYVRANLISLVGEQMLYEGGLRINTTISLEMQVIAEEAVRRGLVEYQRKRPFKKDTVIYTEDRAFIRRFPEYKVAIVEDVKRDRILFLLEESEEGGAIHLASSGFMGIRDFQSHFIRGDQILVSLNELQDGYVLMPVPEAQASMIVLDLRDNSIKAMVGGFSYQDSQFNRATQAKRQPGSAFKPFVFLSALIYGYTPLHSTFDLPLLVTDYRSRSSPDLDEGWKPSNFDGKYLGNIPLYTALSQSRNTVSVRLAQEFTTLPVKYLAMLSGIRSYITNHLSMSLGAASISLLELCHSYSIFPNQGESKPIRYITHIYDRENRQKEFFEPFRKQVVLPQYAYTMLRMLSGVIDNGTGSYARRLKLDIAGKTGTSNNFRDNWFIGFTPNILVGVWVGKDNFESLGKNFTGGTTACPLWTDFVDRLDLPKDAYFSAPHGIVTYPLDFDSLPECRIGGNTSFQSFWKGHTDSISISSLDKDEDLFGF